MTDIVERLRELHRNQYPMPMQGGPSLFTEAADEIERLRAEIEQLREALRIATEDKLLYLDTIDITRNAALDEAAKVATSFLVGDPANGVPLRNPMAHEIADHIRALKGIVTT